MIYVIVMLSLLFMGIGFLLTEKNARYLLSGYNTMSEEERKQVDIQRYVPFFRRFHLVLGISFLLVGSLLAWINENAGGIFLAVYPIMAYIWFVWRSRRFYKGSSRQGIWAGIVILAVTLVITVSLLLVGFKESDLIMQQDALKIEGIYGERIEVDEAECIELVEELPEISFKTNGYAMGQIAKGYFKTKDGKVVKLMLNTRESPYILITKKDGERIYFSSEEQGKDVALFQELKEKWPTKVVSPEQE